MHFIFFPLVRLFRFSAPSELEDTLPSMVSQPAAKSGMWQDLKAITGRNSNIFHSSSCSCSCSCSCLLLIHLPCRFLDNDIEKRRGGPREASYRFSVTEEVIFKIALTDAFMHCSSFTLAEYRKVLWDWWGINVNKSLIQQRLKEWHLTVKKLKTISKNKFSSRWEIESVWLF